MTLLSMSDSTTSFSGVPSSSNPLDDNQLQSLLKELESIHTKRKFLLWRTSFLKRYHEFLSQEGTLEAEKVYNQFKSSSVKPLLSHLQRVRSHFVKHELDTERCTVRARQTISNLQSIIAALTLKLQSLLPRTKEEERECGYSKFHMGALLIRDGFTEYARLTLAEEIFTHLKTTQAVLVHADKQFIREMDNYCETLGVFIGILADLGLRAPLEKCRMFMEESDEDLMTVIDVESSLDDSSLSSNLEGGEEEDEDDEEELEETVKDPETASPVQRKVQDIESMCKSPSQPPAALVIPQLSTRSPQAKPQERVQTPPMSPRKKREPVKSPTAVVDHSISRTQDYYHNYSGSDFNKSWRIADQIKQEQAKKVNKRKQQEEKVILALLEPDEFEPPMEKAGAADTTMLEHQLTLSSPSLSLLPMEADNLETEPEEQEEQTEQKDHEQECNPQHPEAQEAAAEMALRSNESVVQYQSLEPNIGEERSSPTFPASPYKRIAKALRPKKSVFVKNQPDEELSSSNKAYPKVQAIFEKIVRPKSSAKQPQDDSSESYPEDTASNTTEKASRLDKADASSDKQKNPFWFFQKPTKHARQSAKDQKSLPTPMTTTADKEDDETGSQFTAEPELKERPSPAVRTTPESFNEPMPVETQVTKSTDDVESTTQPEKNTAQDGIVSDESPTEKRNIKFWPFKNKKKNADADDKVASAAAGINGNSSIENYSQVIKNGVYWSSAADDNNNNDDNNVCECYAQDEQSLRCFLARLVGTEVASKVDFTQCSGMNFRFLQDLESQVPQHLPPCISTASSTHTTTHDQEA